MALNKLHGHLFNPIRRDMFVGVLFNVQQQSISQGRICPTEFADKTWYLIKHEITWLSLGETTMISVHLHLPESPNPAPQHKNPVENSLWRLQLLYTLSQPTIWLDMSTSLSSGFKLVAAACKHTRGKLTSRTLHSAIAKKQNRLSTTFSRSVPSGDNRYQSWLQDQSTTSNLWGTEETLHLTIQLLAACGMRV